LNAGNKQRGQADGFNLETLSTICDLKGNSNTTSVFDICMKYCSSSLLTELEHIPAAADVDLKFLQGSLNKLTSDFKKAEADAKKATESLPASDMFAQTIRSFVEAKEKILKNLTQEVEAATKMFKDTLEFFVPVPGKASEFTSDSFFGLFAKFVQNYKVRQEREAARAAAAQKNFGKKLGEGENGIDGIIAKVKAGKAKRESTVKEGTNDQSQQQQQQQQQPSNNETGKGNEAAIQPIVPPLSLSPAVFSGLNSPSQQTPVSPSTTPEQNFGNNEQEGKPKKGWTFGIRKNKREGQNPSLI